ncbi:Ectonucleoside triphosphate diphosphohydrolase 7 [Tetrabaena socialis]|uniref:Ectonucleoside triphosphate diphosphohydrolase 7 n=1 Tax=Tetrabaena socialis TaxID=47790 RepID=A0A2J8AAG4_9CHLO|nr:Ectonucleoside triphosphate diphosphohydrolase 7 [Tetrabaena socialis]|eukprot:PNH09507.1 Ectonucleoside triphosphate diphosphohydrolase 7 [Tetrabaena socialis]
MACGPLSCSLLAMAVLVLLALWARSPISAQYVAVIDCGSSGTRIYVFTWKYSRSRPGMPELELIPPGAAPQLVPKKPGKSSYNRVETLPGLDAFAPRPPAELLQQALGPLLDWARAVIPPRQLPAVPLFLFATAGVRRLPATQQRLLMANTREVLRTSGFRFEPGWARIISGTDEGVYGWIAINYLRGNLDPAPPEAAPLALAAAAGGDATAAVAAAAGVVAAVGRRGAAGGGIVIGGGMASGEVAMVVANHAGGGSGGGGGEGGGGGAAGVSSLAGSAAGAGGSGGAVVAAAARRRLLAAAQGGVAAITEAGAAEKAEMEAAAAEAAAAGGETEAGAWETEAASATAGGAVAGVGGRSASDDGLAVVAGLAAAAAAAQAAATAAGAGGGGGGGVVVVGRDDVDVTGARREQAAVVVRHPCMHEGYSRPYTRTHPYGIMPARLGLQLVGAPDWARCRSLVERTVNASAGCGGGHCVLGWQEPELQAWSRPDPCRSAPGPALRSAAAQHILPQQSRRALDGPPASLHAPSAAPPQPCNRAATPATTKS